MAFHTRWSIARSSFPIWVGLVLGCGCALPLVSDQRQQIVVVSVSGDWTQVCQDPKGDCNVSGSPESPLRFGQTINSGDICLIGDEAGSIVLKYATPADDKLYPFPCEKTDVGNGPTCTVRPRKGCGVDVRKMGEQRSGIRNFLATMARITSSQPEKYMVAASRGAEAELVDAVVPVESGQLDLQAVFREMDAGTYYVELAPVGAAAPPGPRSRVSYVKGQAVRAEARGVRGGLYKLALVTEKGEPGDSDCWVLVAAGTGYVKLLAAYQQALAESKKLPAEMDAAATRALLRAYLESLASPKPGVARP
jgi:hypothetical protein